MGPEKFSSLDQRERYAEDCGQWSRGDRRGGGGESQWVKKNWGGRGKGKNPDQKKQDVGTVLQSWWRGGPDKTLLRQ